METRHSHKPASQERSVGPGRRAGGRPGRAATSRTSRQRQETVASAPQSAAIPARTDPGHEESAPSVSGYRSKPGAMRAGK